MKSTAELQCLHLHTVAAADSEGSYVLCLGCAEIWEEDRGDWDSLYQDRELDCRREEQC